MVIAPDSFKESMSAKQAGLAIEQGFKIYSVMRLKQRLSLWQMVAKVQPKL